MEQSKFPIVTLLMSPPPPPPSIPGKLIVINLMGKDMQSKHFPLTAMSNCQDIQMKSICHTTLNQSLLIVQLKMNKLSPQGFTEPLNHACIAILLGAMCKI